MGEVSRKCCSSLRRTEGRPVLRLGRHRQDGRHVHEVDALLPAGSRKALHQLCGRTLREADMQQLAVSRPAEDMLKPRQQRRQRVQTSGLAVGRKEKELVGVAGAVQGVAVERTDGEHAAAHGPRADGKPSAAGRVGEFDDAQVGMIERHVHDLDGQRDAFFFRRTREWRKSGSVTSIPSRPATRAMSDFCPL